jgi:hypothetical protein
MKATDKNSRGAKAPASEKNPPAGKVRFDLTEIERELIIKACTKYKYTLPAYLQSKQPEIEALEAIIEKLA